jgi:hypothetical protein
MPANRAETAFQEPDAPAAGEAEQPPSNITVGWRRATPTGSPAYRERPTLLPPEAGALLASRR